LGRTFHFYANHDITLFVQEKGKTESYRNDNVKIIRDTKKSRGRIVFFRPRERTQTYDLLPLFMQL
jgi:hypothetical protein